MTEESFNVAFELLRRHFNIPKGVLHDIIGMLPPPAPTPSDEVANWAAWDTTSYKDTKVWYNWRLRKVDDEREQLVQENGVHQIRIYACQLCSREISIDTISICTTCCFASLYASRRNARQRMRNYQLEEI